MTPREFLAGVSSGNFENVYYFDGPEELKKSQALEALREAVLPLGLEALNETVLRDCSAGDIIDNAILLPVMCDRRLVIVRDWKPFTASDKKDDDKPDDTSAGDDKRKSKSPDREMLEWLRTAPDSCIIVFYFSNKAKKLLDKEPGRIHFDFLKGAELREECDALIAKHGKTLRRDAFEELALMSNNDLTRISTELDKLAAYTGKSRSITVEDVRAIATPSTEYSVFSILDHLLDNNIAEATRALNALLINSANNPGRIISLFISSMRTYLLLKLSSDDKASYDKTAKTLGISGGRLYYINKRISRISADDLRARYDACVQAEIEVKNGRARDDAQLNALMLQLLLQPQATKRNAHPSNR